MEGKERDVGDGDDCDHDTDKGDEDPSDAEPATMSFKMSPR